MCVTNESLGASVTCRTGAIAFGGGEEEEAIEWQSGRGNKKNIIIKKPNFLNPTNFKLLSQIQGNLINNCDFF